MQLHGLYGIADKSLLKEKLLAFVESSLSAGLKIVQYRNKYRQETLEAERLHVLCERYQAMLIINDDIELAQYLSVGIHLGQNDTLVSHARKVLGEKAIIGYTCHNQVELAKKAELRGCNYVSFGRFFNSITKPLAPICRTQVLKDIEGTLSIPICVIGGITLENVSKLTILNPSLIAVANGLFGVASTKEVVTRTQAFNTLLLN